MTFGTLNILQGRKVQIENSYAWIHIIVIARRLCSPQLFIPTDARLKSTFPHCMVSQYLKAYFCKYQEPSELPATGNLTPNMHHYKQSLAKITKQLPGTRLLKTRERPRLDLCLVRRKADLPRSNIVQNTPSSRNAPACCSSLPSSGPGPCISYVRRRLGQSPGSFTLAVLVYTLGVPPGWPIEFHSAPGLCQSKLRRT